MSAIAPSSGSASDTSPSTGVGCADQAFVRKVVEVTFAAVRFGIEQISTD